MSSKVAVPQKIHEAIELVYDLMEIDNVDSILVGWDGNGDDGQIYDFIALDKDAEHVPGFCSQQIEDEHNSQSLEEYLSNRCYEILHENFSGWEDSMGSQGTFKFFAKNRSCEIIFGKKVIETHEFEF